jgi:SAM-dependent methyltransferase
MYSPILRIILNQLAGISLLRRAKDSLARTPEQYDDAGYNMAVCRHHLLPLQQFISSAPVGQNIIEIGPGGNLGNAILLIASGANRVYCVDNYRHVDFHPTPARFYQSLINQILSNPDELLVPDPEVWDVKQAKIAVEEAVSISGNSITFNPDRIQYLAPFDAQNIPIADGTIDLIFSHAVLEHVKNPAGIFHEFGRILKPGGYTSHVIDLRDHFEPTGLQMLRYPTWIWDLMSSNSHGYVNRYRAQHFEQFFHEAGFKILISNPTELLKDVHRIPVIPSGEFADLPHEQLQIVGLYIVGVNA